MTVSLQIISAGPHASIQDRGRPGFQSRGVPEGGAMDKDALILGNLLVGNQRHAAGIEICLGGLQFSVDAAVKIALTGTPKDTLTIYSAHNNQKIIPAGQAVWLEAGDRVETGFLRHSNCAFIAIGGQLQLPQPFGSAATSANASLGGISGTLLQNGDSLTIDAISESRLLCCEQVEDVFAIRHSLYIVLGPQQSWFPSSALAEFLTTKWRLTSKMSRMGVRLSGPVIPHRHAADILSDGIVTGAIQIPGDGQPIIMMPDHQTTGGYTKIAHLLSCDISALARLSSSRKIEFTAITQEEAEDMAIAHHHFIDKLVAGF